MAAAPHAHDHAHDHAHHHAHAHDHAHAAAAPRQPAQARAGHAVGLSLLRLSALERSAGALALVALLWLGVWWALT